MHTATPSLSARLKPRMSAWLLLAFTPVAIADGSPWYLRGGLSWVTSSHEHLTDEHCTNHSPPALFGCSLGSDGQPIGAYGRLDDALGWDLGVGYRLSPIWRLELGYERVADRSFSGDANFLSVPGSQSVTGDLDTGLLLAQVVADIDVGWERVIPWVAVGAGWARHEMDPMTYRFPGLAPGAVTVTSDGEQDQFAWRAALGVGFRVDPRFTVDLSWSYTDLGWMGTEAGAATIVRARGTRTLEIDGTEAAIRNQAVRLGMRYQF